MREFLILIGQVGFIALLELVLEMFVKSAGDKPHHVTLLRVACIMGSIYLLLQFAHEYLLGAISVFMTIVS